MKVVFDVHQFFQFIIINITGFKILLLYLFYVDNALLYLFKVR